MEKIYVTLHNLAEAKEDSIIITFENSEQLKQYGMKDQYLFKDYELTVIPDEDLTEPFISFVDLREQTSGDYFPDYAAIEDEPSKYITLHTFFIDFDEEGKQFLEHTYSNYVDSESNKSLTLGEIKDHIPTPINFNTFLQEEESLRIVKEKTVIKDVVINPFWGSSYSRQDEIFFTEAAHFRPEETEAPKEPKLSKYEKAYEEIDRLSDLLIQENDKQLTDKERMNRGKGVRIGLQNNILKHLVKLASPKTLVSKEYGDYCPTCDYTDAFMENYKYCPECGQALGGKHE